MNIIQQIEAEQAARLPGSKIPAFQAGDTVVVNVKVTEGDRTRVQAYEGVCIARSGQRPQRELHRPQDFLWRGRRARLSRLFAADRLGQGRPPGQGAPRQALLSARSPRQVGAHRGADRNPRRQGGGEGSGQGARPRNEAEDLEAEVFFGGDITMAEPIVAQKAPYAKDLEAGKTYYWCACGKSANQPFCDGKHKDIGARAAGLHRREERNGLSLRLQGEQERALLRRRPQEPVSRPQRRRNQGRRRSRRPFSS